MPGSSLWLLPPPNHPLTPLLPTLLQRTRTHFTSPHSFIPHITLTSSIPTSAHGDGSSPQKWLDGLSFPPAEDVEVRFQGLDSESAFFRKLYVGCEKSGGLRRLGAVCRGVVVVEEKEKEKEVEAWVEGSWRPHLSLLYHDCPKIEAEGLKEVERFAEELGISVAGTGDLGGWVGGKVVLVPTDKPIDEWTPIAERML